jgi:quinol monooxygenase YgiN
LASLASGYIDDHPEPRLSGRGQVTEQIGWCVELEVQPGRIDSFVALTAEMVDETAKDPGVLNYQRFISEDGRVCHAVERYESSVVAMRHLQTFRDKFAEQFSSMVTRRRFTVYGSPDAELKTMLDGFGATYLRPFGGLPYWP